MFSNFSRSCRVGQARVRVAPWQGQKRRQYDRPTDGRPFQKATGYRITISRRIRMVGEESVAHCRDGGVNNCFQFRQSGLVAQHCCTEFLPVDTLRARAAGKGQFDFRNQCTARTLKQMDRSIGIEQRHRFVYQTFSRRSICPSQFAPVRPMIMAVLFHFTSNPRSSSSQSCGGAIPKNISKASAACPISMSSPSTVSSPSDRADRSKAVFQWAYKQCHKPARPGVAATGRWSSGG